MTDLYDVNTSNRGGKTGQFWICYVERTSGGMHFKHKTLESAVFEAERLAQLPGVKGRPVYLLECSFVCQARGIEWDFLVGQRSKYE